MIPFSLNRSACKSMLISVLLCLAVGCAQIDDAGAPSSSTSQSVAQLSKNRTGILNGESFAPELAASVGGSAIEGTLIPSIAIAQEVQLLVTPPVVVAITAAPVTNAGQLSDLPTASSETALQIGTAISKSAGSSASNQPASISVGSTLNWILVKNHSNTTQVDVPMQIGRAFVEGEVIQYPTIGLNGIELESQASVKTRWSDGSVKFAVLSFYVPSINAGETLKINFGNKNQLPASAGLSLAAMQDPVFDFDASITIADGSGRTAIASALAMLKAGKFTVADQGPISTTIVLADHSSARSFDLGFDSYKSFRPIFHATFWPKIGKVKIRFAGEIANTQALQDMSFGLKLSTGKNKVSVEYEKPTFIQHMASRWTRQAWINGRPAQLGINHNASYLTKTLAIPNFDTSIVVPDGAVDDLYSKWIAAPRGIMEEGTWAKYMAGAGGRPEIGLITTWNQYFLFNGNPKTIEMAIGQADLASAWPFHFREGNASKYFDAARQVPAIGLPISLHGRPTMETAKGNLNIEASDVKGDDRMNFVGQKSNQGWYIDGSHQPDAFSVVYLLTGDPWYLEQMQFWASWGAMTSLSTLTTNWGRGPTMTSGNIAMLDTRHQAWLLQGRLVAAFYSADRSPEKAYFARLTNDALAIFEGMRDITDGRFSKTPEYVWGATEGRQYYGPNLTVSPMKAWDSGITAYADDPNGPFVAGALKTATASWQQYFMILVLSRARDYGFEAEALIKDSSLFLTKQFSDPGADPYWSGVYAEPLVLSSGRYLTSIGQAQTVAKPTYIPRDVFTYWVGNLKNGLEHGYPTIAAAAASVAARYPNGDTAWKFYNDNVMSKMDFSSNPKWKLVPR